MLILNRRVHAISMGVACYYEINFISVKQWRKYFFAMA